METTLHLQQMMLRLKCLHWIWKDRDDYFTEGNLTVYYSHQKRKDKDFRRPDFFVALNTSPHPRKSWMVWEEEGKYPSRSGLRESPTGSSSPNIRAAEIGSNKLAQKLKEYDPTHQHLPTGAHT
ncbi:MAG: hypothetical protein AAF703_01535 [Cyanobacteria bacterium P01_D01_bin.105]